MQEFQQPAKTPPSSTGNMRSQATVSSPQPSMRARIMQLQKLLGNQACVQLLASKSSTLQFSSKQPIQMTKVKIDGETHDVTLKPNGSFGYFVTYGDGKKVFIEKNRIQILESEDGDPQVVQAPKKSIREFIQPTEMEMLEAIAVHQQQSQMSKEAPPPQQSKVQSKNTEQQQEQLDNPLANASYEEARQAVQGQEIEGLARANTIRRLGKESMNKNAFHIVNSNWVMLVVKLRDPKLVDLGVDTKLRGMKNEVKKLDELKAAGVATPDIGPAEIESENKLFDVQYKGKPAKAFLQQYLSGVEMDKNKPEEFVGSIYDKYLKKIDKKSRNQILLQLKADLGKVSAYMEQHGDIPDLQMFFDQSSMTAMVFDPGDPANSENSLDKHQGWLKNMIKRIDNLIM